MKEKVKYDFLYIILLHNSKFYNSFLLYCTQGCNFFVKPSVQQERQKVILSSVGQKFKKKQLFLQRKSFTYLFFQVTIVYSDCFQRKNLVMTKKSPIGF